MKKHQLKISLTFQSLVTRRVELLFIKIGNILVVWGIKKDDAYRFLHMWSLLCLRNIQMMIFHKKLEAELWIVEITKVEDKAFGSLGYK